MVRLRDWGQYRSQHNISAFQFHYGAIKGLLDYPLRQRSVVFQFHYGAIKGSLSGTCDQYQGLFQFHYGAIKGFTLNIPAGAIK